MKAIQGAVVDDGGEASTFGFTEKVIFQTRAEEREPAMQRPRERMCQSEKTARAEAMGLHKEFLTARGLQHKAKQESRLRQKT